MIEINGQFYEKHPVSKTKKSAISGKVLPFIAGAEKFIREKTWMYNNALTLYTIHPSKRNFSLYVKNKESIIGDLKKVIELDV